MIQRRQKSNFITSHISFASLKGESRVCSRARENRSFSRVLKLRLFSGISWFAFGFDSGLNTAYKSVVCFSHSVVGDCSSLSLLWNDFVFSHPSNCLVCLLIPNSLQRPYLLVLNIGKLLRCIPLHTNVSKININVKQIRTFFKFWVKDIS